MNMAIDNPFPSLDEGSSAKKKSTKPKAKQQKRVIAFENSHSWIKRADEEGTMILQAGYAFNPGKATVRAINKELREDVLVFEKGQECRKRLYGKYACSNMRPETLDNADKVETARQSFAAMLRPSDHMQELVVVASHWDADKACQICDRIKGDYSVTVNGDSIMCRVVEAIPILEGAGTWHLLKTQEGLEEGATALYELGFGTTEKRWIDEDGVVMGQDPDESLCIKALVGEIARLPHIQTALTRKDQQAANEAILSRALKEHNLPRLKSSWDAVVQASVQDWVTKLFQEFMADPLASSATNWVLTGGGAELAKPYLADCDLLDTFVIPDNAQTASVRGAYLHGVQVMANG